MGISPCVSNNKWPYDIVGTNDFEVPIVAEEGTVRRVEGRRYSGVFYQTPENAVNVLAGMVDYWRATDAP